MDGGRTKGAILLELLRKKDLYPQLGVAKSTVSDWIEDFDSYIPKIHQGNVTYYRPEALDVLKFIKECREQNYQKGQIMEALNHHGYSVTIEESKDEVAKSDNDDLLGVFRTVGESIQKLSDQDESIERLRQGEEEHQRRIEDVESRTTQTDDMIHHLQQEIENLKQELAEERESKKKTGFLKKWFRN